LVAPLETTATKFNYLVTLYAKRETA